MDRELRGALAFALVVAAAALLAAAGLPAQDSQPEAEHVLHRALDDALPRRAPRVDPSGGPMFAAAASLVDWDEAVDKLGQVLVRCAGSPVEPFALNALGNALFSAGRLDEAKATFEDLKARFAEHPLVVHPVSDGTRERSLVDKALEDCSLEINFRKSHPVKPLAKPVLDELPVVTIHFSEGDVKLRFYKNVAPQHVENFLKLARSGFYDRTRVHRVMPGSIVHLGDPNSRDQPPNNWGKGGPGYTIPQEPNLVSHVRGTVSMMTAPGARQSHGSQFQILLSDQTHIDFAQTPFAAVVEGLDVLDRVSQGIRNQYDAPATDCWINGISVKAE